jgi:hypothetical protein
MLIELWRKVVATEYTHCLCAVCGNDFDRGTVYPVAFSDQGYELGEMCLLCLDYLSRRKKDAVDPAWDNWPARGWPTLQDLEELRRRYPEPMYADHDALAAFTDWVGEDAIYAESVVWAMERETPRK